MDLHSKLEHQSHATVMDGPQRLLLSQLAELVDPTEVRRVVVVDCDSPAFFDELLQLCPSAAVASYNDSLVDENAVRSHIALSPAVQGRVSVVAALDEHNVDPTVRFGSGTFVDAEVVLVRLPKSLDYLSQLTQAIAREVSNKAVVIAAERTKYMTPSQNEVCARWFSNVTASLGNFKSRALRASEPKDQSDDPLLAVRSFPRTAFVGDVNLDVVAHGGVFAGTKLDIGTRVLVEKLDSLLAGVPWARDFVDAGCGTGVLSAYVARARADATVRAVDVSAAAVLSTLATAAANGVSQQITAFQDDALESLAAASADVVVCNPPFHTGTALDTDVAVRMFRNAGRALRPGGQLWTVYNSPLPYKGALTRAVGPTRVVATNRKFTVTVSTKPR